MRWEAANIKEPAQSETKRHTEDTISRQKASETAEAALARLTKSYIASMTCIGSVHRLVSLPEAEAAEESMQQVADAARAALERSILIDPLVTETYAPTWHHVAKQHAHEVQWAFVENTRPPPAQLTSSSHRSTVRELAYLSLVNYADLLVLACPTVAQEGNGILNRGVVPPIPGLSWKDETVELTQRLALVALCDASELDGSDPTVWLKLACAARRLSCLTSEGSYDRLERHALERGLTALPPNVPPNQLVVKALDEFHDARESLQEYPAKVATQDTAPPIILNLPRYSWSMLGRMLLRACREGSAYRSHCFTQDQPQIKAFGSPRFVLKLSPMLVLPPEALGVICQYLDRSSVWKFEATCRGLSSSILSARATMERRVAAGSDKKQEPQPQPTPNTSAETRTDSNTKSANATNESTTTAPRITSGPQEAGSEEQANSTSEPQEATREVQAVRSHRISKRVQSQLITSCKLAERKAKRSSVEFCFLAAILGCSKDDESYQAMLKEEVSWDDTLPSGLLIRSVASCDPSSKVDSQPSRDIAAIQARLGDASLSAFVERWSECNWGPINGLTQFVAHVALNVEKVFAVDPESTTALSTSILECIDTISRRGAFRHGLDPSWYGPKLIPEGGTLQGCMEILAINLLNGELRLRNCERVPFSDNDYDDDGSVVAVLVPDLLRGMFDIETAFPEVVITPGWFSLKARLHWLAAGFYLWWSRFSINVTDAREAESRRLEHIDEAIGSLAMPLAYPIQTVHTPHLESPDRTELHWRVLSEKTLSTMREETQASSVVSYARQLFVEKTEEIKQRVAMANEEVDSELTADDKASLSQIGSDLLSRYNVQDENPPGRLQELIDDFLELKGELLSEDAKGSAGGTSSQQGQWAQVWDLIPSQLPKAVNLVRSANSCILSILSTCMHAGPGNQVPLLLLLSRVAIAGYVHLGFLLRKSSLATAEVENDDGFSDGEDSFLSDEMDMQVGDSNETRIRLHGQLIQFLLFKIADICHSNATGDEFCTYLSTRECVSIIHFSMAFSAEYDTFVVNRASLLDSPLDFQIFHSTQTLVHSLLDTHPDDRHKRTIQSVFFNGLARVLVNQRQTFPSSLRPSKEKRLSRAIRQKVCLNRAAYIGAVSGEMAVMLSMSHAEVRFRKMYASYLINGLISPRAEGSNIPAKATSLAALCESALWFWKFISDQSSDETSTVRLSGCGSVSSFDRQIIETLYAPVACVIVGLCGSAITTTITLREGTTRSTNGRDGDGLCLSEFYDSDSSSADWFVDLVAEKTINESGNREKTELLRAISQAAHCIALVSCELNARFAVSYLPQTHGNRRLGPLLPLVVSRVVNHCSDTLLTEFGGEDGLINKRAKLWTEDYPFGTRSVGALLDSILYQAYRALFGFSLTGTSAQHSVLGIEFQPLPATPDEIDTSQVAVPESTVAVAQLYRCIVRAYSFGRRSPPRAALECVAAALPVTEESEKSRIIRNFLFSGHKESFSHRDVVALVTKASDQLLPVKSLPDWMWTNRDGSIGKGSTTSETNKFDMDDAFLVRKGICHQLAQGPLPLLSTSSADSAKDRAAEERLISSRNERELSKHFDVIVDDLCYGEQVNPKGWHDASQCLLMKADLIADRLGLSKGFSRASNFYISNKRMDPEPRHTLPDLVDEQERDFSRKLQGWEPYLGKDLSVYVRREWSSFSSLETCFEEVNSTEYRDAFSVSTVTVDEDNFAAQILKEVGNLYAKGDYVAFQQAWGGFFVCALRKIAVRCSYVALYLLRRGDLTQTEESFLASDIAETFGGMYYAELMGSQMYGYPMHVMTDHRKRELAETASSCFQFALDALAGPASDENTESKQTWDLVFMRGKCHEKIASTYSKEKFPTRGPMAVNGKEASRAYERHMKQALIDYAASYKEAKSIDDDGGFGDIHGGGSSHGPTEVFYRLHASRLKCLLSAVSQREEDRNDAEVEALRLTAVHWYVPPPAADASDGTRDRVWAVLADVVSALTQCRIEQPFFHRSVYRHAQALMWAPVFYDPMNGAADGSMGSIPATKSHLLRGLNSATPCANSAEVIISVLFGKKRPQLCSVWVTNDSITQSPFALLNSTVRKYDSLRGKYISAYVDTMRLCKRRHKLDELLHAAGSSLRDLPSFYQASAAAKGGPPELPQTKESLLVKGRSVASMDFLKAVKRQVNSAIAVILTETTLGDAKSEEEMLKAAYACYLRLNCSLEELRRCRAWKFGNIPEVDALCRLYLARKDHEDVHAEASNWTGGGHKTAVLKSALEKCSSLFPTLPSNLYGKKKAKRQRKQPTKNSEPSQSPKRKQPEASSATVPFHVTVPAGLVAGDKFDTTVELDGGTKKKIRLTVPAGNPRKLMFSLAQEPPAASDSKWDNVQK